MHIRAIILFLFMLNYAVLDGQQFLPVSYTQYDELRVGEVLDMTEDMDATIMIV